MMAMMNLAEAALVAGGTVYGAQDAENTGFLRVVTDSRTVQPGDLFVALRGERFDGHDHVQMACDAGAVAVMVDRETTGGSCSKIRVANTRQALGGLAGWWRQKLGTRIIAVTGSSGKTTVKNMLAAIAGAALGDEKVWATPGNLNNDIGVPLTLFGLRPEHRIGVIEMGMNHAGEIDWLVRVAMPDVVLINNAGSAHMGLLGSLAAVARAKGEIVAGAPEHAVVVLNGDDRFAGMWRELAQERQVLHFALSAEAEVVGRAQSDALSSLISVSTPTGEMTVRLPLPGEHNVMNALAATAGSMALGLPLAAVRKGLSAMQPPKGRMQRKQAVQGAVLLDDTYNANPDSVRAAIKSLMAFPGKHVVVLGDMGELGDAAAEAHRAVGEFARSQGVDGLLTLGELSRESSQAFGASGVHFGEVDALVQILRGWLGPDVTVLVKGSRFMQMERVVAQIEEQS